MPKPHIFILLLFRSLPLSLALLFSAIGFGFGGWDAAGPASMAGCSVGGFILHFGPGIHKRILERKKKKVRTT